MSVNQRISGPYFPSHAQSSSDPKQNLRINHWCEDLHREDGEGLGQTEKEGQKSKIQKVAPTSFT